MKTLNARLTSPGALEAMLQLIWEDVLSVRPIGAEHDFLYLGGDSTSAARVCLAISDEIGVNLPVTAIFIYPTLSSLASHIRLSCLAQ